MAELVTLLAARRRTAKEAAVFAPILFDPKHPADRRAFVALLRTGSVRETIDAYADQTHELLEVRRPNVVATGERPAMRPPAAHDGVWVYYPWRGAAVHCLDPGDFRRVRTSRNNPLITPTEQRRFAAARVGIAGLNVGNPGAVCLALEGGATRMKFADPDTLTLSNLNRFRAGLADLGLNKAVLTARQVFEVNPFAEIEVWPQGLSEETLERFMLKPRLDVLIEEMDNLRLKVAIREIARRHRIPVLMVTGNGPNVIIDIERFDLNQRLPLLNRYLRTSVRRRITALGSHLPAFRKRIALARDFMGASYLTDRLRSSFPLVGRRLAGIPQLAESSFLRGASLSYVIRQILTGAKAASGRYAVRLDTPIRLRHD